MASGSDDKEIIVWDWEKGKKLVSYPTGHHSNVFQSKFLPLTGDTHLVSTSRDGQVRLAVLSTTGVCRSTKRLAQHKGPANKLALLPQVKQIRVFFLKTEDFYALHSLPRYVIYGIF